MSGETDPPAALQRLAYGTRELVFGLSHSARRRTVGITVCAAGGIGVVAPAGTPLAQVQQAVLRRAPWLVRQLHFFGTVPAPAPAREYVAGETHRYLGRQFRLRILPLAEHPGPAPTETVKLRGAYLHVYTRAPLAPDHTRRLVERWYSDHARRYLAERYGHCAALVRRYDIVAPPWSLRTMPTRWGSFTAAGRILLNPRLVQAPTACIDYLILHELCHVAQPHHGPGFYQLLGRLLPDWPVLRERLNQCG